LAESRAEKGKIRSEEGKKLSLKEIAEVVRNSKEDREKLKNEIAKDLIAALKSEK
jgi:NADPH-dependent 7-cyano-7-deazaguanine reductase QueF